MSGKAWVTHSPTSALKHSGVAVAVSLGERLHHAVDLLSLTRQPEAPQELPQRLDQVQVRELVQLQESMQNLDVELISERQTGSNPNIRNTEKTHVPH